MKIYKKYMTRNDCYKINCKISIKGIMIHSTATPGVMAKDWFDRWNKSYQRGEIKRQVCVHAFVDDNEIYQYLPWNHRGWHAGGEANNSHIGIEICEPRGFFYLHNKMMGYNKNKYQCYFEKAYQNAVNLCVQLCKEYGLTEDNIISHNEGYTLGIASNHQDVGHWFYKHNKNMDAFRKDVKKGLAEDETLYQSIKTLQKNKIINSPEYWIKHAKREVTVNGEYAAILINRMASFINK